MRPYYSHAGITLFHGSVLDVLPQLEASAFDCAIADPCYGEAWCEEAAQRLSQEVLPLGAIGGT